MAVPETLRRLRSVEWTLRGREYRAPDLTQVPGPVEACSYLPRDT
jgi:hypothetical protein